MMERNPITQQAMIVAWQALQESNKALAGIHVAMRAWEDAMRVVQERTDYAVSRLKTEEGLTRTITVPSELAAREAFYREILVKLAGWRGTKAGMKNMVGHALLLTTPNEDLVATK